MSDDEKDDAEGSSRSDAWTDLGLTLPVFLFYHLGVAFLPMRNAADPVTSELRALANHSLPMYAGLTLLLGSAFVMFLAFAGRGQALKPMRFAVMFVEGCVYAAAMRAAGAYVLGALPLGLMDDDGTFANIVMSLGAGFYEELVFRVGLFGVGAWIIKVFLGRGIAGIGLILGWAAVTSVLFSAWHYVGPMADTFDMASFAYRATCGFVLAVVYTFRGFAPAVWTHALYDVWALALSQ